MAAVQVATGMPTGSAPKAEVLASLVLPEHEVNYPPISGMSEIHIFLLPLNPSSEIVQRYNEAVDEYNAFHGLTKQAMKAVFLCLDFRGVGHISVMQSSRYFYGSSTDQVLRETYYDGKWFADRGFDVLRHKIECLASGPGVPVSDTDAEAYPKRYFEFHLRVRAVDSPEQVEDGSEPAPVSDAEIAMLKDISNAFATRYQTPVPLSFNHAKAAQRYLNVRFASCGSETARDRVAQIREAIDASATCRTVKIISEYVWYDDNRALDSGWIDFSVDERERLFGF